MEVELVLRLQEPQVDFHSLQRSIALATHSPHWAVVQLKHFANATHSNTRLLLRDDEVCERCAVEAC